MQLLITHGSMARTRALQFQRWQLVLLALALVVVLMAGSGAIYHFIFLKAAREGWPVVSSLVRLVPPRRNRAAPLVSCAKTWTPWPKKWVRFRPSW